MEERVPPASTTTTDDNGCHYDEKNTNHTNANNCNNEMQSVSSNPSTNPTGGPPLRTYIVQIPKDQIYRVPPPEHAKIVERYRNPAKTNRRCTTCMSWTLSLFFTLAFLTTLIICVYHFTLNPKLPTFSVRLFTVKHPPTSKKNASPKYKVSVGTTNPNRNNDIEYSHGSATLSFKEKVVGTGYFPPLDKVEGGKSDIVDVVLNGSAKAGLPGKVKSPASLDLKMVITVKLTTWLLTKNKEVNVDCEFEVNSFGNNAKVLSQNCASN